MLIQFTVANYRSFKDEAILSLVVGPGREHRERNVREPVMRGDVRATPLLRSAAIYGANAAGKTNLIRALDVMRRMVVDSSRTDGKLPVTPFLFDAEHKGQPTRFEVACIVDGIRYQYGFSATQDAVVGEWLHAWPQGRPQLWFKRHRVEDRASTFEFGGKLQGDREVWRRATRGNALFLSTAATLNSRQLRPLYDWFKTRLHVASIGSWSPARSVQRTQGERKPAVVWFLQAAGLAVSDLRVVEQESTDETFPGDVPPEVCEDAKRAFAGRFAGRKVADVRLVYRDPADRPVELDMDEESDGTQKLFALAGLWVDALRRGHVVVVDGLHGNLHPTLVRHLVERLHDAALDSDAQLVFSTHDTSILSPEVFRRDQIWFCERNARHETELVPLSDFHPREGIENFERSYLAGRYGAVPYIRSA